MTRDYAGQKITQHIQVVEVTAQGFAVFAYCVIPCVDSLANFPEPALPQFFPTLSMANRQADALLESLIDSGWQQHHAPVPIAVGLSVAMAQ